ncbi:hypothetical protein [Saccharothrix xinjiangensis]|uniref:Uncharacterized protein n=1 Tax=Saccharothrix xinjiangensis TaxID=204798 RepID=A0ABV9Y9V9_9PSEU
MNVRAKLLTTAVAALLPAGVAVGYAARSAGPPAAPAPGAVSGPRLVVPSNGVLSTVARSDPGGPR